MPYSLKKPVTRRGAVIGAAAVTGIAAAALTVPAFADSAAPVCDLRGLPDTEPHIASSVKAIDSTGEYIAGVVADGDGSAGTTSRIWHGEESTTVDADGIVDVNANGWAVGTADLGNNPYGWVYADGAVVDLPRGDNANVIADGINDDGVIVGHLRAAEDDPWSPAIWESAEAEPQALELPEDATEVSGDRGEVRDINAEGAAAGYYYNADQVMRGYVWHADGTGEELLPDSESDPSFSTQAVAISGDRVLGTDENGVVPMVWTLGSDDEPTAVRELDEVADVSSAGAVVGTVSGATALVTGDNEFLALPGLSDDYGDHSDGHVAISEDGSVIAGSVVANEATGNHRAVAWDCA